VALYKNKKKEMALVAADRAAGVVCLRDILERVLDGQCEESIVHSIMLDRVATVYMRMLKSKMCEDGLSGRLASVFFAAKMESQDWERCCDDILFRDDWFSRRADPEDVSRLVIRLACEAAHTWWDEPTHEATPPPPTSNSRAPRQHGTRDSDEEESLFLC
jgi:hypothetical protein